MRLCLTGVDGSTAIKIHGHCVCRSIVQADKRAICAHRMPTDRITAHFLCPTRKLPHRTVKAHLRTRVDNTKRAKGSKNGNQGENYEHLNQAETTLPAPAV